MDTGKKMKQQNRRSELQTNPPATVRPIDAMDRKILSALRLDARLTMAELAQKVGLSQSPCWTRVKRLEQLGVIEGYVAVLNHKAIGLTDFVFIEISLERHDDKMLDRFGDLLARIPEVVEAHLVTGEYDYLVKVAISGTEHYERFLREHLYRIEGIRQSRSTFALRALKRSISVDPTDFS